MPLLGIAIIGTGMIGAVHRRAALLAGAEVRGVAASSPQRAREVAHAWNVPRAYRDIEDVVADPRYRSCTSARPIICTARWRRPHWKPAST